MDNVFGQVRKLASMFARHQPNRYFLNNEPCNTKSWNDNAGDWQNLAATNQVPRYEAIARIIDTFCPGGSILDIGCGEAVLLSYLLTPAKYLGLEPSMKAAELARTKAARDNILHTTAEDFDAGKRQWDCVIFNEMLYYTRAPLTLVRKYAGLLRPHGIMIVSIFQKPDRSLKRRLLEWALPDVISNMRCTKIVYRLMATNGWTIEVDDFVAMPGTSDCWRIFAARPKR
jgi:2-polyprenyl-3-methyl-5-hydroxy-6-metoxy-1,4-benzoquinol methylase